MCIVTRASTCVTTRASTCVATRASTCVATRASSNCLLLCASTCSKARASTCVVTRASTCVITRASLLFKNMPPGCTSHRKLAQLQGPSWIPSGSLSFLFHALARTIVIWLVFLIPSEMEVPGWHDGFSEWSLGGYIISIIGVFLFNNIVILPTIQKYRNKNRSM